MITHAFTTRGHPHTSTLSLVDGVGMCHESRYGLCITYEVFVIVVDCRQPDNSWSTINKDCFRITTSILIMGVNYLIL